MIQHARRLLLSIGLAFAMTSGSASAPAMAVLYLSHPAELPVCGDRRRREDRRGALRQACRRAAVSRLDHEGDDPVPRLRGAGGRQDRAGRAGGARRAPRPSRPPSPASARARSDHRDAGASTRSANDAAVAMAEKLGGTEQRFATLMTLRAHELGMTSTTTNANGLPDSRNISTARDLAILSRAVMRDYPQYYRCSPPRASTSAARTSATTITCFRSVGVDGLKTASPTPRASTSPSRACATIAA